MPGGELWRRRLQYGKETTYGVDAPATRIAYVRDPVLTREREPREHRFATASRDNVRARTLGAVAAGGSFELPMSADEMVELCLIAIQGGVTPTTPAGFTTGRQWQFRPGNAAPDSATFELDDGANVWQETGCYIDELSISGSVGAENIVSATLFGKERTATTLTGALTERTPTFMEGWETALFVDAAGGTAGTTQYGGLLINWDVTISNGLGRKYTADNTLAASKITLGELTVTANLTFEADQNTVDTEMANWDAETARLVRLQFGGNEVLDVGVNEVQLLTKSGTISGGTYTLSFRGQTTSAIPYNATAATVQAALEALPAIGPGNVTVTGGSIDITPLTLTFVNALSGTNVPQVTANVTLLTGSTPGITPTTTTPGTGSKRAVMIDIPGHWTAVDVGGDDAGTRTYQFGLGATYDATLAYMLQILLWNNRTTAW